MYCVALRREVFQAVGPLDEAFGIGMFEDDDYSLRVRRAGWRVACAEDAYVHHVGQGSFQSLAREEYEALWSRNQAHYEKKWGEAGSRTSCARGRPGDVQGGWGVRRLLDYFKTEDYKARAAAESRKWGDTSRWRPGGR